MDQYVTKQEFERLEREVIRLNKDAELAELKKNIGEMISKHIDRLLIKIWIMLAVEMIVITIIPVLVQMYFAR
ncbi:hypothetical protein ACAW68_10255 [Weissella confusa]|uniref:hypothetical protein n=1 Tax=Weissella confusa TaxID=1583 RepID=UPI0035A3872F